ncbi:MAG: Chemotaxis protein CheY [Firmicutes bacterium ADurb.Bin354]|nr:MAG: Chemotaxis protein CheY [Firmicutes bacterium ADurb.Bin354]
MQQRKRCILVVDDDTTYLRTIRGWLKDSYRVGMANSGMQALTWLAGNTPDLILLDYDMPVTDGPQVLKMIHGEPGSSDIPVMFLTGRSDKKSIMKVLSLKPAGYLLKSIDRNTLLETLDNYFLDQMMKDSE